MPFARPVDRPRTRAAYEEVLALKEKLGDGLVILTHHYQRPEIVEVGDFRGDSFELSARAADQANARHIVFCGVHFMAESARVVAREDQRVFHPNLASGCPMADMAAAPDVQRALHELAETLPGGEKIVPVAYMNTDAAVKALCGRHGGLVCTSSNSDRAFRWAFGQGDRILFVPDEHLGRNTANKLGISPDQQILWDPALPLGGHDEASIRNARVIVWKGYCHVHTWYRVEHIAQARGDYPGCKVVVHPECTEEVVGLADAVGSTALIVRYVAEADPGDTIVIGTELNLTARLAVERSDCNIVPLSRSLCPNMFRISMEKLRDTIVALPDLNEIVLPAPVVADARLSMERMLALPAG